MDCDTIHSNNERTRIANSCGRECRNWSNRASEAEAEERCSTDRRTRAVPGRCDQTDHQTQLDDGQRHYTHSTAQCKLSGFLHVRADTPSCSRNEEDPRLLPDSSKEGSDSRGQTEAPSNARACLEQRPRVHQQILRGQQAAHQVYSIMYVKLTPYLLGHQVKVCRTGGAHGKGKVKFIFSVVQNTVSWRWYLDALIPLLLPIKGTSHMVGSAPKGGLERDLAAQLD